MVYTEPTDPNLRHDVYQFTVLMVLSPKKYSMIDPLSIAEIEEAVD